MNLDKMELPNVDVTASGMYAILSMKCYSNCFAELLQH